jgi:hypothetical protein
MHPQPPGQIFSQGKVAYAFFKNAKENDNFLSVQEKALLKSTTA